MHSRKESPFASRPLSLGPSRLPVRQSAVATAEDHRCRLPPQRRQLPKCCSLRATQQLHLSERWPAPGDGATLGRRKLAVSLLKLTRHVFVDGWLSRCLYKPWQAAGKAASLAGSWQGLYKPCQLVQALPAACQGEDSEESEEVGLGGPFKHMMKL